MQKSTATITIDTPGTCRGCPMAALGLGAPYTDTTVHCRIIDDNGNWGLVGVKGADCSEEDKKTYCGYTARYAGCPLAPVEPEKQEPISKTEHP